MFAGARKRVRAHESRGNVDIVCTRAILDDSLDSLCDNFGLILKIKILAIRNAGAHVSVTPVAFQFAKLDSLAERQLRGRGGLAFASA